MDNELLLSNDDFKSFGDVVDAGKYTVKALKGAPRIKVAKSGNRYLSLRFVTAANEQGEDVRSGVIYHTVPLEGTNKKGQSNKPMFASTFTALGFEQDATKAIYAALMATAPAADQIGNDTTVTLSINGDPIDLGGRVAVASIKKESFTKDDGSTVESNRIGSLWAAKESA